MDQCPSCGARVPGGRDGCQGLFNQLLAREFSDYRFFRVHRMNVDSYSLQHPEEYCASTKSLLAHLCGLCCALEHAEKPELLADLRSSLDGKVELRKPSLPRFRGNLTIQYLSNTADFEQYFKAATEWAVSVWKAYEPLHTFARAWLLAQQRASRRTEL